MTTAVTSVGSAALLCGIHHAQPGIVSVGAVQVQDLGCSWGGLTIHKLFFFLINSLRVY